ncbi:hypothetical protein NC653_000642 [Populus alba x Populus x berolinensis]|uniref:Uncharacterized protein n=1 Tax=Populus alba x Populus x berolinensis TaxID=444605 RepID=A0AAD6RJ75_9ROSI|nr:hypothetical protein NC653_000642 [Populus alba x Populus x berolinensis]
MGATQMMAFTAMFEGGEYGDSLNFYGMYKIGSTQYTSCQLPVALVNSRMRGVFRRSDRLYLSGQHFIEMVLRHC